MPNDALDLNLDQVQAVIDGYSDRVADLTCLTVWTGFYSAYYANTKHAKSPTQVIRNILDMQSKQTDKATKGQHHEVDMTAEIEKFAQRDLARLRAQKEGN